MIENLLIVGGVVCGIIFCIVMTVLSTKNYIILKKSYKKTKKSQEKRLEDAMRFYLLSTQLKYKIRSGWDETHWNVSKERLESIAEHVYGTCILAISIDSEFETYLNINKVIKMLAIHEIGEVVIGDITPFDNITHEEKMKIEHKAMKNVLGDLIKKDELYSLLLEFDNQKTKEAIFAYQCDKLECDLQSKLYDEEKCVDLKKQPKKKIINNKRVKELFKQKFIKIWDANIL